MSLPARQAIAAAVCLALAGRGLCQEPDSRATLDFEVPGAWLTAPDLLGEFREEELWSARTIPFADLAGGLKLSAEHVKRGRTSGVWRNHPRYPTLHTTYVPRDWSGAKALRFWAYSEDATGERITLAALSDNPDTAWRDYLTCDFVVDWQGWQGLRFPLEAFSALGTPAGWSKVDALYLFTKIADREPNPYTVLHLDALELSAEEVSESAVAPPPEVPPFQPAESQVPAFDPAILNHRWPETPGGKPVLAPIQHEPYFLAERAVCGYYPRFQPGCVSFDPTGKAFVRYGSTIIQTLGADGRWTYHDLYASVVEPFAREKLGSDAVGVGNTGQTDDASLRFDRDGDAYALCFIWDPTRDARTRRGLLLHSRDGLRSWTAHVLPHYMARFEMRNGHNAACLDRPPLILLSTYFAPTTVYLLLPEKQADGSLVLPEPVKVAEQAIPFIPHSGESPTACNPGRNTCLVYGQLKLPTGHVKEDGVPAYAVEYDPRTQTLSAPVLIGFGGSNVEDDHNWPGVAVDSRGYLHAIINGHHDPFVYVRSTEPYSIASWTAPERVAEGTSYAGLVIDSEDTLYTVTRCAEPGYYFRLSLHRKRRDQLWEAPKHLVLPFKAYYHVWFHKLVIDPKTDRLFLSYWAQSTSVCLFRDEYRAYLDIWPHREQAFLSEEKGAKLPNGTYCCGEPRNYEFYSAPPSEPAILVSDDHGDTWHLATTADFR